MVSNQLVVGVVGSVGRLELDGRDVAAVPVEALGVVPVHPRQCGEFDLVDGLPWTLLGPVDELGLVVAVDRLGEGVVVGLSPTVPIDGDAPISRTRAVQRIDVHCSGSTGRRNTGLLQGS